MDARTEKIVLDSLRKRVDRALYDAICFGASSATIAEPEESVLTVEKLEDAMIAHGLMPPRQRVQFKSMFDLTVVKMRSPFIMEPGV